jgi:hypothetical protein
MAIEVKAPDRHDVTTPSVFLAGSIEMGKAELWQDKFAASLADLPITVLNPRREDWNKEWVQDIKFSKFREQVDWEMDFLETVDVIALYFQPGTMSPISLLELGLHASSGRVIVCCPEGYWRLGNVQVVCSRFNIPLVESMDELIKTTREKLVKCLEERANAA